MPPFLLSCAKNWLPKSRYLAVLPSPHRTGYSEASQSSLLWCGKSPEQELRGANGSTHSRTDFGGVRRLYCERPAEKTSALIFSPGRPPQVQVYGQMIPVQVPGFTMLTPDDTRHLAAD